MSINKIQNTHYDTVIKPTFLNKSEISELNTKSEDLCRTEREIIMTILGPRKTDYLVGKRTRERKNTRKYRITSKKKEDEISMDIR